MSAAWEAFVASIDVVKLERERAGVPSPQERPGSQGDRSMRVLHALVAERFRRSLARVGREREVARSLAEAAAYNRAVGRERARRRIEAERAVFPVAPLTPRDRLQLAVDRDRRAS